MDETDVDCPVSTRRTQYNTIVATHLVLQSELSHVEHANHTNHVLIMETKVCSREKRTTLDCRICF